MISNQIAATLFKVSGLQMMSMMSYASEPPLPFPTGFPEELAAPNDLFLDDLLHQKSRIFASKLEVLAAAMVVRIELLAHNLDRIESDRERAQASLENLDRQARYHLREHRDKNVFYQTLSRLQEDRRVQGVECWRDIFNVLREFLGAWEAHQQSQSRAKFLEHVGT